MIIFKAGTKVKDIRGEEYILKNDMKVKPIYYLNSRLIFELGGNRYAGNYSNIKSDRIANIEFLEDDGKEQGTIKVSNEV